MKTHNLLIAGALSVLATAASAVTWREGEPGPKLLSNAAPPVAEVAQVKAERGEKAVAKAIAWEPSFEAALEKAKAEGKLVMVDFYADWCGACRSLDSKTFTDAGVIDGSRRFVNVKVDVEKRSAIAARYGVRSLPTVGWLRGDGSPIGGIVGAYPPKPFLLAMEAAQKRADERAAKSGKDKS